MIYFFNAKPDEVSIRQKEVYRYLGYGHVSPTDEVTQLIEKCTAEFNQAVNYKACYTKVPLSIDETNSDVDFGFMKVHSKSLIYNLKDCQEAYIFAATTGAMAERLITKQNRISALNGIVTDAIGSAAIEAFCDQVNKFLGTTINGQFLRPRFSCGYGDFPLEFQPQILSFLDTSRKIGLNITDTLMMTPVKSVTAVVGISPTPNSCRTGCIACEKTDCPYRK